MPVRAQRFNATIKKDWASETETDRRPTRLGDVHRRVVRERLGGSDVRLLEELVHPARGLVDRHVREPRVDVRHAVVDRREQLVVEEAPRVRRPDRQRLA